MAGRRVQGTGRTTAPRPFWRPALDCAAMLALLVAGLVGFGPAFGGSGYLLAAGGGLLLGSAIAVIGARFRLNLFILTALTLVAYLLFGSALATPSAALAGVVPTLDSLRQLVLGIVFSWKDVLTLQTPVGGFPGTLVVPLLLSLVASVLALSLALRFRRGAAWALMPAAAYFVAAIVFGTRDAALPVAQGIVFIGVALLWWAVRRAELASDRRTGVDRAPSAGGPNAAGDGADAAQLSAARSLRTSRLAGGAGLLVVALAVGAVAGGVAGTPATRDVLRDQIDPPLDIHDYASPLVSFRKYVRDDKANVLFTVQGLPDNARVRLATLDAYDGIVYNVAADGSAASGDFKRVSEEVPASAQTSPVPTTPATLNVTVGDLTGPWVPDVGAVDKVTFTGGSDRASTLANSLHYNAATGVSLSTVGLAKGDTYTMDVAIPVIPGDDVLVTDSVAGVAMPKVSGVADAVSSLGSNYAGDASDPLTQLRNVATSLSQNGFFSHGLEGESPSRAGHGEERLASMLSAPQMVGDDEQYAVMMALMARELGYPARVVMGFYPEKYAGASASQEITGDDLHAWVEVDFQKAGWVTFDPTPPKNQVPTAEAPKPRSDPKAQVLQPPPPPQEPAELPPDVRTDNSDENQQPQQDGFPVFVYYAAGGGLLLLLALLAPLIIIGALKVRRRNRRRTAERAADRLSGGWDEIVDRAGDLGTPVPQGVTRRESANTLATVYPTVGMVGVAERADNGIFGPGEPTPTDVDGFWAEVEAIVRGMGSSQSGWRRLRARTSLASFRARRAERRTARRAARAEEQRR
ncbi:hypothetical protein B7R54_00295 [Subtercola boreus]|uniref:Transglutaminase-like domain-containing protein n=1 Tax=Subtercola boreus TaxID=120213 RepID=A0A3E0VD59_9MICO|nr:transglutaminase-like domain-containing protein [Subtercola boreus]RFA07822.1 hypothetical protein B7R54_00295 [Subtercola boreus]TQL55330.1 transglutaminase superfamily protein [Subtercola boreus]